MKKKYVAIIILLGSWAKSCASDVLLSDSPGSMRHDLQDADGEWELVAATTQAAPAAKTQEEQKKEIASKKPLGEQIKSKLVKLRPDLEIDVAIAKRCGTKFSEQLSFGALIGGKQVCPLAAARQMASELEGYVKAGNNNLDKQARLKIACLVEKPVFEIVFKDHPEALKLIQDAKIDQALRLKHPAVAESPVSDTDSESNEPTNDETPDDPSTLERASSDDESEGPGLFKLLKNMANFFTKRGNESSSDDEE